MKKPGTVTGFSGGKPVAVLCFYAIILNISFANYSMDKAWTFLAWFKNVNASGWAFFYDLNPCSLE